MATEVFVPNHRPCTACGSDQHTWKTLHKSRPLDVCSCADCGAEVHVWAPHIPTPPLDEHRCANCGARSSRNNCIDCELDKPRVMRLHEDLRDEIARGASWSEAAREAYRAGRRVAAVKLASYGSTTEDEDAEICRAMRLWLLVACGEGAAALAAAREWVRVTGAKDPLAIASLAHIAECQGETDTASQAYDEALEFEPDPELALARVRTLISAGRHGRALLELTPWSTQRKGAPWPLVVTLAEAVGAKALEKRQFGLVSPLLEEADDDLIERCPSLLLARAHHHMEAERPVEAREDVTLARRLRPDHPMFSS